MILAIAASLFIAAAILLDFNHQKSMDNYNLAIINQAIKQKNSRKYRHSHFS
jgi:negative regulator of sigma E activity